MNTLLILTDEQTFSAVGCYGNPLVKTPNLDRLAQRGVRFTRHTTSSPVCTPARASLLTGQYTRSHGAYHVGWSLDRSAKTVADRLTGAGYVTGAFGKLHLEPELTGSAAGWPSDKPYFGFAEHGISEDDQRGAYLDWVQKVHPEHFDEVRRTTHESSPIRNKWAFMTNTDHPGHVPGYYPSQLPEEITQTGWIGDQTRRFIDRRAEDGRPFFALCSFVQPHHPWNPVAKYLDLYDPADMPVPDRNDGAHGGPCSHYNDGRAYSDRQLQELQAAYYAMVTQLDAEIGRILAHVESRGLADDTAVIFTTDHGDYNGERGMIRKGAGWYDSLLHIPMIAALPDYSNRRHNSNDTVSQAAGITYDGPTQLEDIAPTILQIAGLDVPVEMPGHSLLGVLRGESRSARRWSYHDLIGTIGISDERWKLICYQRNANFGADAQMVLTDLASDPLECKNLIDDPGAQTVKSAAMAELLRWLADTPTYMRPPEAEW